MMTWQVARDWQSSPLRMRVAMRAAAPAARRGGALRGARCAGCVRAAAAAAAPQPPPPGDCVRRRFAASAAATRRGVRARAGPPAASAAADVDDAPHPALSPEHPALKNVAFVLCEPGGPANVGGAARALQNFGLSDFRVVAPGAYVVADVADAASPFVPEAYEYAGTAQRSIAARNAALTVLRHFSCFCSERWVAARRREAPHGSRACAGRRNAGHRHECARARPCAASAHSARRRRTRRRRGCARRARRVPLRR